MLKLHGKIRSGNTDFDGYRILTITKNHMMPNTLRAKYAYFGDLSSSQIEGFGAYITFDQNQVESRANVFLLDNDYDYLSERDIVRVGPEVKFACLFRPSAKYNTLLLTEQCNHYCLMCSQPPKNHDDSWLLEQANYLMETIPRETKWMGFSGGEPTLYGDGFVDLLAKAKSFLPSTGLDVLTNGRTFASEEFAQKIAKVGHPNCTFGIPIYSDDPQRHDYVVQAEGAFDETIKGILNLKSLNQRVEIRIVIHKQTIDRLIQTCEFIVRNLLFVEHVALMGLEITGFTRANLDSLWIDPYEYRDTLSQAVNILNTYRVSASVYNHQLCTVNPDVLSNYQKSISDWKNEYVSECDNCSKKSECGGFFSSSKEYKYSDNIRPFL
jgi:His-Xaa-Ser system radical SAM maturase HxsC